MPQRERASTRAQLGGAGKVAHRISIQCSKVVFSVLFRILSRARRTQQRLINGIGHLLRNDPCGQILRLNLLSPVVRGNLLSEVQSLFTLSWQEKASGSRHTRNHASACEQLEKGKFLIAIERSRTTAANRKHLKHLIAIVERHTYLIENNTRSKQVKNFLLSRRTITTPIQRIWWHD